MAKLVATKTLKDLDKLVIPTETVEIGTLGDKTITMEVKKYLSMRELNYLAELFADIDWMEDEDGTMEYRPQNIGMLFPIEVVRMYTNLNLPNDIEEAYQVIHSLGLFTEVLSIIEFTRQYEYLEEAIEMLRQYEVAQHTGLNGLLRKVGINIDNFDANKALEMLQSLTPEQLENFNDLKEIKDMFATDGTGAEIIDFPRSVEVSE